MGGVSSTSLRDLSYTYFTVEQINSVSKEEKASHLKETHELYQSLEQKLNEPLTIESDEILKLEVDKVKGTYSITLKFHHIGAFLRIASKWSQTI